LTPAAFPEVFAHGWALPKPEGFLNHFRPLLDPDACFVQPLFPAARGVTEIEQLFRALFGVLPDLTLTVTGAAATNDAVYIESVCTATIASEHIAFDVCDRFRFRDGRILERHSYSNPIPILTATLRHPSAWRAAGRAIRPRRL
jgi:limonene-1,2-epoxide hydrolase